MAKSIIWLATAKGENDVIFDRCPDNTANTLSPEQKLYDADDKKTVVLPLINLQKAIYSTTLMCAVRVTHDLRKYKAVGQAFQNYVRITPLAEHHNITYGGGPYAIPFLREDRPVEFSGQWNKDGAVTFDPGSGIYIRERSVPAPDRSRKGLTRNPVLPTPWELKFNVELIPNPSIDEETMEQLFIAAGRSIGIGSWRSIHGRFSFSYKKT